MIRQVVKECLNFVVKIYAFSDQIFLKEQQNLSTCLLSGCTIFSSRAISEVGEDEVRVMALLPGVILKVEKVF